MYPKAFKNIIDDLKINNNEYYIGTGNPNSKILVVGKETAISDTNAFELQNKRNYLNNLLDWESNIKNDITTVSQDWNFHIYMQDDKATNNPLFSFKGVKISDHKEGQTWRKYQKLYDAIFSGEFICDTDRAYNFQENFFLTEMSDNPFKTTQEAKSQNGFDILLQKRKDEFFTTDFINSFQIVVLACGDYIWNYGEGENKQILNIFGTDYVDFFETKSTRKPQRFYIHKNKTDDNNNKPKLVIHTNQLSGSVASNELLINIGSTIRRFMNENKLM